MPNPREQSAADFFAECKFTAAEIIEMFELKLIERDEARRFLGMSYNKQALEKKEPKTNDD